MQCIVTDDVCAIGIIFMCINFDVTIYWIAIYIVDLVYIIGVVL